jgi:hypothetical protein
MNNYRKQPIVKISGLFGKYIHLEIWIVDIQCNTL